MNISAEVSSLESLVESLKAENSTLNNSRVAIECENAQLRHLNNKLQSERDNWMREAAELQIIIEQAGGVIVHGMNKRRAWRRTAQEQQLEVGEDPPRFLTEAAE